MIYRKAFISTNYFFLFLKKIDYIHAVTYKTKLRFN